MIRILTLPGRDAEARRARLRRVEAWMGARGWKLADYAEEAGSALFERPPEAPPLPWRDATRWLPGPECWRPAEWLPTLRAEPRLLALPAGVLAVGLLLGLALFAPSSFDAERLRRGAENEGWYTVTASQLNVREAPAAGSQVVGVLYRDQRVLLEGEVNETWVKVGIPERGYVARQFLAPAAAGDDGNDGPGGER